MGRIMDGRALAAISISLFLPALAGAQTWINTGAGDWYNGGNWLGGAVPTSGTVVIDNGGTAEIDTSGSMAVAQVLDVGDTGTGSLVFGSGTFTPEDIYIGREAGSLGAVTVNGGIWSSGGQLYAGYSGTGSLTITGGEVSEEYNTYIGYSANSSGTVLVSGGTLFNNYLGTLYAGYGGTGSLTLSGSGVVSVDFGSGTLELGHDNGASGVLQIGNGDAFTGSLGVSQIITGNGSGTVIFDMTNTYGFSQSLTGNVGVTQEGSGTTFLTGGGYSYSGATRVSNGTLVIDGGSSENGTSSVTVDGPGNPSLVVGDAGGPGSLVVNGDFTLGYTGSGSLIIGSDGYVSDRNGYVGYEDNSSGTIFIGGGTWNNAIDLYIGYLGAGVLTLDGNAEVDIGSGVLNLGNNSGFAQNTGVLQIGNGDVFTGSLGFSQVKSLWGTGTVIFDQTNDYIFSQAMSENVGILQEGSGTTMLTGISSGSGAITVSGGALVIGGGGSENGAGAVTVDGDAALVVGGSSGPGTLVSGSGDFIVGNSGTGFLSLGSGGYISADGTVYIGNNQGSLGVATVTGGTWNNLSSLIVGDYGTGSLTQSGGYISDYYGYLGGEADSSGTAVVSGGTWNTVYFLDVGRSGTGTLVISGSGVVEAGEVSLGGVGTLQIGDDDSFTGTLTALELSGTGGTGTVIFDQNNVYNFSVPMSGNLSVVQEGGGTTILTGSNSYSGATTISAGELQIGNGGSMDSLGSGVVIDDGILAFDLSGTQTVANAISGSGSLIQEGSNTTILTGSNTYDGTTTISAGELQIGVGGSTDSLGSGAVVDNGILALDLSGTQTMANAISGSGSLIQEGNSTTILTGSSTYTGATVVSGGTMVIDGGGAENGTASVDVDGATGNASLVVGNSGGSGTLATGGDVIIGNSGSGSLTIGSGGYVSDQGGYIGDGLLSTGTVLVNGGTWNSNNVNGVLVVGESGRGSLTISGGYVSDLDGTIGDNTLSTGTVLVSGGAWNNIGELYVGNEGTGSLTISGGYVSDELGFAGFFPGSSGTVFVSGGTWNNFTGLQLGSAGQGSLTLSGSGVVEVDGGAGGLELGFEANALGTLQIGDDDAFTGTLEVSGVSTGSGTGEVIFDQTNSYVFTPTLSGNLSVVQEGSGTTFLTGNNAYSGPVTVSNGSLVIDGGGSENGTGSVTVDGTTGNASLVAGDGGGAGSLTFSGDVFIGDSGTGSMTIGSNGNIYSGGPFDIYIGNNPGASGTLLVNGGTWNTPNSLVYVGDSGTGSLTIGNSGYMSDDGAYIGNNPGSAGTVLVNGGTWNNNAGTVFIGSLGGTGSLTVENGGYVSDETGLDGYDSQGEAIVNDGTWHNTAAVYVGDFSQGSLTVENGGYVSDVLGDIGYAASATGSALVSGGTWNSLDTLDVGDAGTGTLILSGSGSVVVKGGAGVLTLGNAASGTGTLQVGNNDIYTGVLDVAQVTTGSGTGTVIFNQTNNYTFAPSLSGNLRVVQEGSGTTVLTGSNTYTGTTTVTRGTLMIGSNDALSASSQVSLGGGTLALAGGVTVIANALDLTDDSVISFSGSDTLRFGAGSGLFGSGGVQLSIYGWDSTDILSFGTDTSGLTAAELQQIYFYGTGGNLLGTAEFSGVGGDLTYSAVPEPATWALAGAGLALLLRRRIARKN